jgi:hypothetical protein
MVMRNVVVVLEGTKARAVFDMREHSAREVLRAFDVWLASATAAVQNSGVCKSFGVGVHVAGADCDHEAVEVGHGHAG